MLILAYIVWVTAHIILDAAGHYVPVVIILNLGRLHFRPTTFGP